MFTAKVVVTPLIVMNSLAISTNITNDQNAAFEYIIINTQQAELRKKQFGPFESIYSVCNDPTQVCQDAKCCPMKDQSGYGCCPFRNGICCPKLGRCCRSGYKCISEESLDWMNTLFGEQFTKRFHCILDYKSLLSPVTNQVQHS